MVDHHFQDLQAGATVIEPSCGERRFLIALPESIRAIGVELYPVQAQIARDLSGRQVLTGDYLSVDLPQEVDAIVGNPPFLAETVAAFLERSHDLLRDGGRCGFILPAYILQTSSKVMRFAQKWFIETELMPRNIFPGLSLPITFTVFTKDRARKLHGFLLYRETADVAAAHPEIRSLLDRSRKAGSVWRQAVNDAFDRLGGRPSHLAQIY